MRVNQPVTQREYAFDGNVTLMSTTDLQSHITYANAAFISVCGYTRDELMNQPHNMVRHPDMPKEAFADMWQTLKDGKSWTALVKNRRQNGDHYWVRANATPMVRGGQLTGYMSVRTQPSRAEIQAAEALYQSFREGRAGSRRFHQGLVVRTGLWAWRSLCQRMSVGQRMGLALGLAWLLQLGVLSGVGLEPVQWAVLAGTATVGTVLAGAWLWRQIARPLQLIARQAQSVASGSLDQQVHFNRVDEIGMILRSVNQAGLNLRALCDDVGTQVSGITTASEQIAQGNNDLAARTERNASSLQQTAAAMEQFSVTVRHNADHAHQASELAHEASAVAGQGGTVVTQVVQTMQDITQSSRRIADIIGVIDGIAFQTNILALNAAVEAARAGEQGRGFAVVAGEVRSLAQRSAQAAKEIKELITASVNSVEAGSAQVAQAGQRMQDIVHQVERVTALVNEITASSREQASGAAQVQQAVSLLDETTQQNAALVEQSAAAADSLKHQTLRLDEALAVYRHQVSQRAWSSARPVLALH